MDEWFVCVPGGATVGPVSTSLLILGIRSGKVPDDALVCRRGEKTWRPVFEVTAFVDALPGASAFQSGPASNTMTSSQMNELVQQGPVGAGAPAPSAGDGPSGGAYAMSATDKIDASGAS